MKRILFLVLPLAFSLVTAFGQKKGWCSEHCPSCLSEYHACYKANVDPLVKGKTRAQRQAIAQQIRDAKANCERQYKNACKAARESRK